MTNISNLHSYIALLEQNNSIKHDIPRLPVVSDATRAIYQQISHEKRVIPDLRAVFEQMSNCHAQYTHQCKVDSRDRLGNFTILSGIAAGLAMAVNTIFKAVVFGLSTPVALSLAIPLGVVCGIAFLIRNTGSGPSQHEINKAKTNAFNAIRSFVDALKDSPLVLERIEAKLKTVSSESEKKIYTTAMEEIRAAYGYSL